MPDTDHRSIRPSALLIVFVLVLGGGIAVALGPTWASGASSEAAGVRYVAEPGDSICGLDDVRRLSNPARVRYGALLDATAERKRIRAEKIDPESPIGQILEAEARRRVAEASRVVMQKREHCSVWKAIRRRDGKSIPDITRAVLPELERVEPLAATGD